MTSKVVSILASLCLSMPAMAESGGAAPKEERIGVGGGLLVGAAAGGPIGMIIGAAIGGLVGNKVHVEKSAREDFEQRFAAASADLASLEAMLDGTEEDVAALEQALNMQASRYRDALRRTLAAEIYFHTGESAIDTRIAERLTSIGAVLSLIDDFTLVIEGHADGRGDAEYNAQLSADRALAVRDVLVAAGVPADRITATGAGEALSTADEKDLDSLALERRVQVNLLYPESEGRVARQR